MKTSEKIKKAIVKKFKIWSGNAASREMAMQKPGTSNGREFLEEPEKPLEDVLNIETTMEEQALSHTATTDAAINIEITIAESCENSNIKTIEDQVTSPMTETLNVSDSLSLAEIKPCFDSGAANEQEKPLPKATQQRQAILAGIVGIALLICSVEFYVLKIHVTVAVVVGIVGLVCIGLALYNALKPDTKLEEVKGAEQPVIAYAPLNPA